MKTKISYHEGHVLLRLAATYTTILQVISEAVQNALDKNAKKIQITIDRIKRTIVVQDNGDGVSPDEFQRALESIGKTIKRGDKLGRFGLGLIASIDKCAKMIFTSTPKSNFMAYRRWVFVKDDLEKQRHFDDGIQNDSVPNLRFVKNSNTADAVWWRTELWIEKYTTDRLLSKVSKDTLRDELLSKYSVTMSRSNAICYVTIVEEDGTCTTDEIVAPEYSGEKLPEIELVEKDSGSTKFRLFLARKHAKGRTGRVQIGESGNDFRISFRSFAQSLPDECRLNNEVLNALNSGVFEGEILSSKARFAANRKGFEHNDALVGFCASIEQWFAENGSKFYREAQDIRRDERYQDLGVRSLRVFEELLRQTAGEQFKKLIAAARRGTIGTGHFEVPGKPSDMIAIATTHGGRPPGSPTIDPEPRPEPDVEKPQHRPMVVVGPKGERRITVKSNSLGLTLVHDNAMNSSKLFEFEPDNGTLRLNTRHPLWVECDQAGDVALMRFQEFLMVQALWMHLIPEDWRDTVATTADDLYPAMSWMIVNGDELAQRRTIVHKIGAKAAKSVVVEKKDAKKKRA